MTTTNPIPWAHEASADEKRRLFELFLSGEAYGNSKDKRWDLWGSVFFISTDSQEYGAYYNGKYCGPYEWKEVVHILKDDGELKAKFFEAYSKLKNQWFLKKYSFQDIWIKYVIKNLLELDELESQTTAFLSRLGEADIVIYVIGILRVALRGSDNIKERALEKLLGIMLGPTEGGAGSSLLALSPKEGVIILNSPFLWSAWYGLFRHASQEQMIMLRRKFPLRLKKIEENMLQYLADSRLDEYASKSHMNSAIVSADSCILRAHEGDIKDATRLSGEKELMYEVIVGGLLSRASKYKRGEEYKVNYMIMQSYHALRGRSSEERNLLWQRSPELIDRLEKYCLGVICNPDINKDSGNNFLSGWQYSERVFNSNIGGEVNDAFNPDNKALIKAGRKEQLKEKIGFSTIAIWSFGVILIASIVWYMRRASTLTGSSSRIARQSHPRVSS